MANEVNEGESFSRGSRTVKVALCSGSYALSRRAVVLTSLCAAAVISALYMISILVTTSSSHLKAFTRVQVPGCKHYYIDLGTNNAHSIVDFISGTVKSAHKEVRPIIEYRDAHSLSTRDFCVYGFEPNPVHNSAHAATITKLSDHVKQLTIFSETIAGSADGKTSLMLDQSDGGGGRFPAWGSSVMEDHVAMNRQNNTQRVSVRSMDFSKWLTDTLEARSDPNGHVLIRMDIEGSEFAILRDLVNSGVLCKKVNKFVIEWHAMHFNPRPDCVRAMYEWMISSPKCKVQMQSIYKYPPVQADCNGWLLSNQLKVE
jgi:Methyltransferase FkbM domain